MFKLIRIPLVVFAVCFSSLTASFADFGEEKEIIDAHSPATFKAHLTHLSKFTLDAIEERKDPRFQKALDRLGIKKAENLPEIEEGDEYDVIVGGLFRLHELTQLENPVGEDILEAAEVSSVLLSPEIFPKNFSYVIKYNIYEEVIRIKKLCHLFGLLKKHEKTPEFYQLLKSKLYQPRAPFDRNVIISKYFTPLVFTGKNAVFSEEGYLYALSKGIMLYGLPKTPQSVHGGILKLPAEVFIHDGAHNNDIMMPDPEVKEETYQGMADFVKTLAGRLYALIHSPDYFSEEENPKAFRAATHLFHENHVYESRLALASPKNTLREKFERLRKRFNTTFKEYFQIFGAQKPPSTMTEEEKERSELQGDQDPEFTDSFHFMEKFASDSAKQICEIYPEAEKEIFGTETDLDRNVVYHGENVLKWTMIMMDWFCKKVRITSISKLHNDISFKSPLAWGLYIFYKKGT